MQNTTGGAARRNSYAALGWAILAIVAAGVLLRSLRLAWQPLWWDEGYSIYFASEPLARMAWLTANDIHPPLYYALLHGALGFGNLPIPENSRLLSVLFGGLALPFQYFLARAMFGGRRRLALLALLLLAFSPLHLYYSQEVRMYGLALVLGLAASLALWQSVTRITRAPAPGAQISRWRQVAPALGYLLAGLAALYTLYYAALLLAAHAIWAVVQLRKQTRALLGVLAVYLLMFVLYLPWLLYAVPQLVGYVGGRMMAGVAMRTSVSNRWPLPSTCFCHLRAVPADDGHQLADRGPVAELGDRLAAIGEGKALGHPRLDLALLPQLHHRNGGPIPQAYSTASSSARSAACLAHNSA